MRKFETVLELNRIQADAIAMYKTQIAMLTKALFGSESESENQSKMT
jgi:hypothetical protein